MVNRILNLVGYLGMAMVAAALAIRFGYPAKEQWAYYLAWGGLVCVLLYTLSQWREIGATALDPVTGYNRFRTGDAKRVVDKPADMVPSIDADGIPLSRNRMATCSACATVAQNVMAVRPARCFR